MLEKKRNRLATQTVVSIAVSSDLKINPINIPVKMNIEIIGMRASTASHKTISNADLKKINATANKIIN